MVPPQKTRLMKHAGVCPIQPRLRPTIIYSRDRRGFDRSRAHGLLRLMRGAYLKPERNLMCWEQRFTVSLARAIAALQLLPSARCLTHTSAALVQGLAMWTHEPDVYIAVPSNPRMTTMRLPLFRFPVSGVPKPIDRVEPDDRRVLLRRRRLDLADDEIRIVGGVPVTHALRTAFDCACDEPPFNALSIADSALRQYCRPDPWNRESCRDRENEARAYWDGLASRYRGRKGIVQARAVLAAASPWAVLPGESVLRWMVLVLGLPEPALQHRVDTRAGERFIDLCWPRFRIAVEFDGRFKYKTEDDVFTEKLRQDDIQAQGWIFLRVTWEDLREMRQAADRLLALFPGGVVAHLKSVPDLQGAGLWGSGSETLLVP